MSRTELKILKITFYVIFLPRLGPNIGQKYVILKLINTNYVILNQQNWTENLENKSDPNRAPSFALILYKCSIPSWYCPEISTQVFLTTTSPF